MFDLDTGLSSAEARRRAGELLSALRTDNAPSVEIVLSNTEIETVRAACELLTERFLEVASTGSEDPAKSELIDDVESLYGFVYSARWPEPDFGERAEVLAECAFVGWRTARRQSQWPVFAMWECRLEGVRPTAPDTQPRITEFFEIADKSRDCLAAVRVLQPEMLPLLLASLRADWERLPSDTLTRATVLFDCLQAANELEGLLSEERNFLSGEAARITSRCYGFLSKFSEAGVWLERAEHLFQLTCNPKSFLARTSYGRLALALESREFDRVLNQIDPLTNTFESLSMSEDALKARIIKAVALKESDRLEEAEHDLVQITDLARRLENQYLEAVALVNLLQVHAFRGNRSAALRCADEAVSLTNELDNPAVTSKLLWGIGQLFRAHGETTAAINAFRRCLKEFSQLGLRSDAAGVYLIIADILLDAGQEKQAEWEIRQALPLIDEYKLVPEGFAAMTLLRESLRRQMIDRVALRNLHGYFEDNKL